MHLKPNNFPRYIDQLTELEGKINEIDATKFNHSVKKSVEVENENENENEIEIEYPRDYDFANDLGNAYEEDYSHIEEIDSNENENEGEEPMSRWFLVRA